MGSGSATQKLPVKDCVRRNAYIQETIIRVIIASIRCRCRLSILLIPVRMYFVYFEKFGLRPSLCLCLEKYQTHYLFYLYSYTYKTRNVTVAHNYNYIIL